MSLVKKKRVGENEPLEKDIQNAILKYLRYRKKIVFWRQNSGSFTALAIRAVAGVLKGVIKNPVTRNAAMAAIKRAVGHYKCTSEVGLPDITVVYRGVYVGLEVKRPSGKQSKVQEQMQAKMLKNGARYFVVKSVADVEKIIADLDAAFDNQKKEENV